MSAAANGTSSRSLARPYTPSGVAAIATLFCGIPELTPALRNTAARAILRAMKSADDPNKTCKDSGLDQMYLELHGIGEVRGEEAKEIEYLENNTLRDLVDAISTFERMNGGITLFLHCPGYNLPDNLATTDIKVDIYTSPRELKAGDKTPSEDIALLVQHFGQTVARPHLQRFLSRCMKNTVTPSRPKCIGTPLLSNPYRLPLAQGAIRGYTHCRVSPGRALYHAIARSKAQHAQKEITAQPIIDSDSESCEFDDEWSSDHEYIASQYDDPPAVKKPNLIVPHRTKKAPRESTDDGFFGALISIGPETDAVLKQFGIQDAFIPRLRVLSQTVRNSEWQFKLRTAEYGLTFEQAVNIANAMERDIMHKSGFNTRKVETSYKTNHSTSLLFFELVPFNNGMSTQIGSEHGLNQFAAIFCLMATIAWTTQVSFSPVPLMNLQKLIRLKWKLVRYNWVHPNIAPNIAPIGLVLFSVMDYCMGHANPKGSLYAIIKVHTTMILCVEAETLAGSIPLCLTSSMKFSIVCYAYPLLLTMVRTRFYQPLRAATRSTQGDQKRKTKCPKLSKDVRAALCARHKVSRELYGNAIKAAVSKVNEITESVATSQHKTIDRVDKDLRFASQLTRKRQQKTNAWNAWIWSISQEKNNIDGAHGKDILQTLVSERKNEYEKLTNEEREKIVRLFEESKATQATARRISGTSRINDISATMIAVENELKNLRSRTGAEVLLYATRGTTDFSIEGYSFSTKGVDNFLERVIKIDTQEFLSKMEGFAIQGIRGAADNYKQRISRLRSEIRGEISDKLKLVTGNEKAKMEWKFYWEHIVRRYKVVIEGWPESDIPFKNLSETSSSLEKLKSLLELWQSGKVYWKNISDDELSALEDERRKKSKAGEIVPPDSRGEKRSRTANKENRYPCRASKKYKTTETVYSDDDENL